MKSIRMPIVRAVRSPEGAVCESPARQCRVGAGRMRQSGGEGAQRGYILLSLLLVVALISIIAATAASSIAFKIRRDREEELIHRGAEYSRAIRRYTKKVGHYPLRIEDLENTDGLRFLRKRYKDPITGADFKLLHMTDLQRVGVGGLSAAVVAPAAPSPGIQQPGINPTNSPNGLGGNVYGAGAAPTQSSLAQPVAPDPQAAAAPGPDDPTAPNPATPLANAPNPQASSAAAQPADSEPIGGGVIVGVVSASKRETIREFNHKNHYSDWLFFYDPAFDRGLPIKGPTQTTMPTFNNPAAPPPGTGQSGTEQPSSPQSTQPPPQ